MNKSPGFYFPKEHNNDIDLFNYTWYYKTRYIFDICTKKMQMGFDDDKIGISLDGNYMIHDGIMWKLDFFNKHKEIGKNMQKFSYIIYKFSNGQNIITRNRSAFLSFKYSEDMTGKVTFLCIIFNNAEFKKVDIV